ncbi:MAG TPA: hypothetical protein VK638_41160 [Edaphobacter sp.]|nr:hypothetical protein [Edaphobacter sp.]
MVGCFGAGFLIALFGHAAQWPTSVVYGLATLFVIAPLRHIGRLKHQWRDYELTLGEDCIQQIGQNGLSLTLQKSEIGRMFEVEVWAWRYRVRIFTNPFGFLRY